MGESQQPQPLRSINSQYECFVRFINTTPHCLTLYWIDYQGNPVNYGDLPGGDYREINTFATHPWIFVNKETQDRYLVNKRDVFFPEPWFVTYLNRPREQIPQRIERTNVYVVLPLYTLQELSMRVIKKCLAYDSQAFVLDIPRCLQVKLFTAMPKRTEKN